MEKLAENVYVRHKEPHVISHHEGLCHDLLYVMTFAASLVRAKFSIAIDS